MYSEEMSSGEIVCTIDDPGAWVGTEDIIYKNGRWSGGILCTIVARGCHLRKFYVPIIGGGERFILLTGKRREVSWTS